MIFSIVKLFKAGNYYDNVHIAICSGFNHCYQFFEIFLVLMLPLRIGIKNLFLNNLTFFLHDKYFYVLVNVILKHFL